MSTVQKASPESKDLEGRFDIYCLHRLSWVQNHNEFAQGDRVDQYDRRILPGLPEER